MNKFLLAVLVLLAAATADAQTGDHKIVFDLNDADTATHSTVLRQFNNILNAAPGTELELVVHGKAIYMFAKDKMYFEEKIKELKPKGKISYKICANSLKRFGVDKSLISPLAEIVPVAILELSAKQKEGWSYIKAGQ